MNKQLYLRAFSITTLKTVVYLLLTTVSLLFLGDKISALIFGVVSLAVYFINTFLFSEWLFKGEHIPILPLAIVIAGTYVWDTVLALMFNSWLLGRNLFATQEFVALFILFLLHAIAMSAAYYIRKRYGAERGLAEGLEA